MNNIIADSTKIVHTGLNWQVREHCIRGYFPWWSAHKKRRFLRWSWWSGAIRSGEFQPIIDFIIRWENWPVYEGSKIEE